MGTNSQQNGETKYDKLKAKGKKAFKKLRAVNDDRTKIQDLLNGVSKKLKEIIEDESLKRGCSDPPENPNSTPPVETKKQRSMILKDPERIEFSFNRLSFYIDFTIETFDNDDKFNNKGCIIYGANRTLCFSHKCIHSKGYKGCGIISRCDGLEDKPLLSLSVSSLGTIESVDKLENEVWDREKEKDLLDLHYRALDKIWVEALAWTNETLLP